MSPAVSEGSSTIYILTSILQCSVSRMDRTDTDGFVWKVGKDSVDKILQFLEHPHRDNCLPTRNDG